VDQATIIRRAVLATDGSEQAHAAAVFASSFAWPPSSIIWVASVIEAPPPDELAISRMRGKGFSDWRQVLEQSHLEARDQAQLYVSDAAGILRERHPEVEI
jgi:hypothetical protein